MMHANPKRYPSFKAPSRNANCYESTNAAPGINRSRSNFGDICDETWPLDEVINKIDVKSDSEDDQYDLKTDSWTSGPQLVSETIDSGRNVHRVAGNGTLFSSFNQGTKVWKDTSVKHRKFKTKKPGKHYDPDDSYLSKSFQSYDLNNNYLEIDDVSTNMSDDYQPLLLRDVGIQCNLKKFKDSLPPFPEESLVKKKPPIKVIKSSNNGIVSTFSDVPKLTSPNLSLGRQSEIDLNESIKSNDAIYSQVDKSHKNRKGNIDIVYKQPLNDSLNTRRSFNDSNKSSVEIKSKEYGLNIKNPVFSGIHLPNPHESIASAIESKENRYDKEILEETISISNSSSDEESLIHGPNRIKPNDNYSLTSKTSSNHHRKESPLRTSMYDGNDYSALRLNSNKDPQRLNSNKKHNYNSYENDENVLLENNSLRLKSSKTPHVERLHKSNADLREQFLRDETRGGLAAAYKNRQLKNQNRQRTLSLNRMNATIRNEEEKVNQSRASQPSRHLSQSHLSSRSSDIGGSAYPHRSSRSMQHERDPIVMYIPPVNHLQRMNESSPKLTSILRNNSIKSNATMQSKTKKLKQVPPPPPLKSQSKTNLKEVHKSDKSNTDKKKVDITRRYSMPKDTKFNWLSKFKLKSK